MASVHPELKRQLGGVPLVLTMFFCVSGGAYGLESVVSLSGPGMAMVLVLLTPIVWALPIALMSAELGAAIPREGGYYVWVKEALGPFAGFLCAWWSWVYSLVDVSIYPVLFAAYASTFLKVQFDDPVLETNPVLRWLVAVAVIVAFTYLNVRGIRLVGRVSMLFGILLLFPFAAMVLIGLPRFFANPGEALSPLVSPGQTPFAAFGAGLYVVMWNYLGWDSLSTVAEEVEDPARAYPRALGICVPLITAAYALPLLAGLASFADPERWTDGAWPEIARAVGGPWLGMWVNLDSLVALSGLFMTTMLAASRIPFVLARDRFLPPALARVHPRFGTPYLSILICAAVYAALGTSTFQALVQINVILYSAALLLELASLLVLRRRRPDLSRPFRIRGGWPVLWLCLLLPAAILGVAISAEIAEDGWTSMMGAGIALATGPIWYFAASRIRSAPKP